MRWYTFWADVIVTVHLGIVSFVLFGLILILLGIVFRWQWVRNFWFRLAHLVTIGVVVVESLVDVECPFTVWERDLRIAAGQDVSQGSFVGQLMHNLLFYDWPEWVFSIIYCVFGAIVLSTFFLAPPRWPWRRRLTELPALPPVPPASDGISGQQVLRPPHFSETIQEKR